jgi:hypothetical protein
VSWRTAFIGLAILFAAYAAVSDPDELDVAEAEAQESIAYRAGLTEGARQAALNARCGYREFLTQEVSQRGTAASTRSIK